MPPPPADHFSPIAAAYTIGRFGYPTALYDFLREQCAANDIAWDCATGSGQGVPELATRFAVVVATDISETLLRQAPPIANVRYAQAPAERSTLATASVDLVTVGQALHWFDLPAFWTEVRRVVKPGGVLAFWGYTWPMVSSAVDAVLDAFRTEIAPFWPERSRLLHDDYRTISAPFTPIPAPSFEISETWKRADYLAHIGSWSAVRYFREKRGYDPLPALDAQFAPVWQDGSRNPVHWTLHLHVYRC